MTKHEAVNDQSSREQAIQAIDDFFETVTPANCKDFAHTTDVVPSPIDIGRSTDQRSSATIKVNERTTTTVVRNTSAFSLLWLRFKPRTEYQVVKQTAYDHPVTENSPEYSMERWIFSSGKPNLRFDGRVKNVRFDCYASMGGDYSPADQNRYDIEMGLVASTVQEALAATAQPQS